MRDTSRRPACGNAKDVGNSDPVLGKRLVQCPCPRWSVVLDVLGGRPGLDRDAAGSGTTGLLRCLAKTWAHATVSGDLDDGDALVNRVAMLATDAQELFGDLQPKGVTSLGERLAPPDLAVLEHWLSRKRAGSKSPTKDVALQLGLSIDAVQLACARGRGVPSLLDLAQFGKKALGSS